MTEINKELLEYILRLIQPMIKDVKTYNNRYIPGYFQSKKNSSNNYASSFVVSETRCALFVGDGRIKCQTVAYISAKAAHSAYRNKMPQTGRVLEIKFNELGNPKCFDRIIQFLKDEIRSES